MKKVYCITCGKWLGQFADYNKSKKCNSCSKLFFNARYFQKIDKNEKAYFLGFLFADGSIVNNSLKWTSKDVCMLNKFKKFISSKNVIHYDKKQDEYKLGVCSPRLRQDLEKLNFIPRKTFRLKFPKIKSKFISHFIRGYFDGDGCIYFQKNNYPRLEFYSGCGSFLEEINKIIGQNGKIRKRSTYVCFTLGFNGKKVYDIMDYLYKDAKVYLKRKFDKLRRNKYAYQTA